MSITCTATYPVSSRPCCTALCCWTHLVERTQLEHVLELVVHVSHGEDSLGNVLQHRLLVLEPNHVIKLLDEARHVTIAQQAAHKGACIEGLQVIKVLTRAIEGNGCPGLCYSRERTTTLSVSILRGRGRNGGECWLGWLWLGDGSKCCTSFVIMTEPTGTASLKACA